MKKDLLQILEKVPSPPAEVKVVQLKAPDRHIALADYASSSKNFSTLQVLAVRKTIEKR